jgi:aspartyl-tRNA(Asn)/glutamyl-tRNA(Gln) amidotransferase subunit C
VGVSNAYDISMSSPLTRQEVEHVAKLARLSLSDEEIETFTEQLGAVLEYAQEMNALDITDLHPTAHPLNLENVMREDEYRDVLSRDEVLAEAPEAVDDRFGVPRILGEEP